MNKIPGYTITKKLNETKYCSIYLGYQNATENRRSLIFRIFKRTAVSAVEALELKHVHMSIQKAECDFVEKAYDIVEFRDEICLIFEKIESITLHQFQDNKLLKIETFLEIAGQLAKAVTAIHDKGIIHSSIRPNNILISNKLHQIKLSNIRLLFRLPNEKEQIYKKEFIANVLPFISPEQTGRMNREMDYRSDFYSLGITFYKMVTGELPFISNDPMEVIHNHIAVNPSYPSEINSGIPCVVSDIIMRLITKNSDDRYQSGEGLEADIENCRYQLKESNKIEAFTIGRRDIPKTFQISQKLYGREDEVESLISAFDRVVSRGSVEMVLVKGYSGIGKSALVHEINRPIVQKKGYFIKGKYEQLKKDIPYSAITQAFGELVKQLLTESEDMISKWQEDILNALGHNGQVIIDVISELELLTGKQPPLNQLSSAESQNRFNMVFEDFIKVFTKKEYPLVIFLDDLQWCDLSSLQLIKLLMESDEIGHLLLIGAYRDNEVDSSHPLMITLGELTDKESNKFLQPGELRSIIHRISLNPLEEKSVNELIADTLNCDMGKCSSLSKLVCKKTDGNPFFIKQFLKVLYEEKLLIRKVNEYKKQNVTGVSDSSKVLSFKWCWDIEKVNQMQASDNVVDLMSCKLNRLSAETKRVLTLAACIGSRFDLSILSAVNEKTEEDTFKSISQAINRGFIVFTENSYSFLHDRIQEAAYNLIPDKNKSVLHYKIGRLMYRLANVVSGRDSETEGFRHGEYDTEPNIHKLSKELENNIFSIVDQINHGIALVTDHEEMYYVAWLNLIAGKKAKAATAYGPALNYLKTGMGLLREECWLVNYDLAFELFMACAECEYLNGNFEEAETQFDYIIRKAKTNIEKARAYMIRIDLYTNQAMYIEAIRLGVKGLYMLGIKLSDSPGKWVVIREFIKARWHLRKYKIEDLLNVPIIYDTEKNTTLELFIHNIPPAYFLNIDLATLIILKMFNYSLRYGNLMGSPDAYACYGFVIISMVLHDIYGPTTRVFVKDIRSGYKFGKLALALNEQLANNQLRAKLYYVFGALISHWNRHVKISLDYLRMGFQYGLEDGDLLFSGYCVFNIFTCMIVKGDNLRNIFDTTTKFASFIKRLNNPEIICGYILSQKLISHLQGTGTDTYSFNSNVFVEDDFLKQMNDKNMSAAIDFFFGIKLMMAFLFGNYSIALNMALESCKTQKRNLSIAQNFLPYLFYPLTLAAIYPTSTAKKKKMYWKTMLKGREKLKMLSVICPENFLHKYLLISAEMARIAGKDYNAMGLYDQAIASAHENEYTQNEAIANELAAKFYLARGKDRIAKIYMKEAYDCYQKWGATGKLHDLEESYPQLDLVPESIKSKGYENTNVQVANQLTSLDMASILKASQTLSENLDLDKLLFKLMNIVIENAGACKGYIILEHKGRLYIEAESAINGATNIDKIVPIDTRDDIAHSVINYVKRTIQHIVLDGTTDNNMFISDPYIIRNRPKSTLCMPIVKQTRLVGILYLENSITSNAFTTERIETLRLLSSQVAISLENAVYYRNLQGLNKELKQLVTAMESIDEGIVITDTKGKIFYANPSIERVTGYKPEDVAGKNMSIFNSDNQKQTAYYDMWNRVALGEVWSGQIVSRKKDGTLFTERITVSPVYDAVGRIVNFVAVKNDITGEIKLESRLRNKQKLESIGTLAGGIAHDFNNLLMAIIGYTELTRDELPEESDNRDNLDQALKASYNATNMIQRILTFSRQGEQGQMQLNITSIVKDTLRLISMSMPTTIEMEQNLDLEIGEILADPTQIQQVLINLCTNAKYAMQENGGKLRVELGMEYVDLDFADSEGLQMQNCVRLKVVDNGIGMPAEIVERIFDPFFTTKKIGDGTGMGLAIVHGIIKNHGGAITVSSRQGKGSEFSIFFPIVN